MLLCPSSFETGHHVATVAQGAQRVRVPQGVQTDGLGVDAGTARQAGHQGAHRARGIVVLRASADGPAGTRSEPGLAHRGAAPG